MLKHVLGAILIVFPFFQIQAQGDFRPGYIITTSGDSISGLVDYRTDKKNSDYCFFKQKRGVKQKRYTPDDLKAYGYYFDKRYESLNLPATKAGKHFAQVIIKGNLGLLRYKSSYFLLKDSIIYLPKKELPKVVRSNNKSYFQDDNRYKGILNLVMRDCRLASDKIEYTETDLSNITQNYNRCKGEEGMIFKGKKKRTQTNFSLHTGLDFSALKFDGLSENTFRKSNNLLIGAGVEFSAPRVFDRLFFATEFQYVKKRYQGFLSEEKIYTDIFLDISFLKVPVSIRYNFLQDSNTPFIRLGVSRYFDLLNSMEVIEERMYGNTVTTTREKFKFDSRNQTGFWVGIGYSKSIGRGLKLIAEGRYENGNSFVGPQFSSGSSTSSYSFLIGIRY